LERFNGVGVVWRQQRRANSSRVKRPSVSEFEIDRGSTPRRIFHQRTPKSTEVLVNFFF
jgi:hypothetical protein